MIFSDHGGRRGRGPSQIYVFEEKRVLLAQEIREELGAYQFNQDHYARAQDF